jgi:nicotinamidase-related amidase
VVFSNDAHRPQGDAEFAIWGPHAIAGTPGAQVIPELTPQPSDCIVPKRRYSGFQGTDLDILLNENNVDTVVLTGLHTNICVRHTAADAFYNGYRIIVPEDAVDAFSEKDQVEGLAYLKQVYGAKITTTGEAVASLLRRWCKEFTLRRSMTRLIEMWSRVNCSRSLETSPFVLS